MCLHARRGTRGAVHATLTRGTWSHWDFLSPLSVCHSDLVTKPGGGKSIEQGWESPPPLSTITLLASVQMDRTHRILSPGCCSQRCVNDITRLPGTTARVPFKEPLFHFTAPTFQEEALCAVSLLLCYTAPRATSRLPPSSVCLIENSIQLTSNTH